MPGVVEVRRDEHGVAHVRAQEDSGAFFGQGWVHAHDRWTQMEEDRRRAYGQLAEHCGPAMLASDQFWRSLGIRGVVEQEYRGLDASSRAMVDAYTAGVNAALAAGAASGEAWRGVDSLAVFKARHLLMGVIERKLWWSRVARQAGGEALVALVRLLSGASRLIVPPGASASGCPVDLDGVRTSGAANDDQQGSNSWVLGGSRTASGHPLLAGDPHREVELPNVYYQVHLTGQTLNAIGLSFPGVPGLPHFGHNRRVAWAITHTGADAQDLYVARRTDVATQTAAVKVAGGPDAPVALGRTAVGPVVAWLSPDTVLVLRATALEPAPAQYRCLWTMLHADSLSALLQSQREWVDPVNNFLGADVDGHVGYVMRGRVPIRPVDNLLGPVPAADPRHDWTGFIPFEEAPRSIDPPSDMVVTANNRVAGPDYPYAIAPVFAAEHRARRIEALLLQREGGWTADALTAVHVDVQSAPAAAFARWAGRLSPEGPTEAAVLAALSGWDGTLDRDSPLPLVYNTWRERVAAAMLAQAVGEELAREAAGPAPHPGAVATLSRLRARAVDLAAVLPAGAAEAAFHQAVAELVAQGGPDPSRWRWGALHRLAAQHPRASKDSDAGWPTLAVELPGDGDTVRAASYGPGSFQVTGASVARYVFDLGNWDASGWVVPGGTAERGPGALSQLDAWASGQLIPMWFSEVALAAHVVRRDQLPG